MSDKVLCPKCKKVLLEKNMDGSNDLVIKSRLVFLNESGEVLGRCLNCRASVVFPLNFVSKSLSLEKRQFIDL